MSPVRESECMARHTSWGVGGPADYYFEPANRTELIQYLAGLDSNVRVYWLGLGSNVLISDSGVRGVVISTKKGLTKIESAGTIISVEAGVKSAALARFAANHGLTGLEFMVGIPGTVGGAIATNAGANGQETWDHVERIEIVDRKGNVCVKKADEFSVGYRSISLHSSEYILAVDFKLAQDDPQAIRARMSDYLRCRRKTQPIGVPSCGCVFKNPVDADSAGRLIDDCGLKGLSIGGASVSEKHANFIVSDGSATADDIRALIDRVQDIVYLKTGVMLATEVVLLGGER